MVTIDPEIWSIIGLSVGISISSTLMAAGIGIPLGILLGIKRFKGKTFIINMANTFMGFPPVVMGLIIFLIFS
ncbi:MAG: ABC transporter permease, partial [Promethearchaeota archaeon]